MELHTIHFGYSTEEQLHLIDILSNNNLLFVPCIVQRHRIISQVTCSRLATNAFKCSEMTMKNF